MVAVGCLTLGSTETCPGCHSVVGWEEVACGCGGHLLRSCPACWARFAPDSAERAVGPRGRLRRCAGVRNPTLFGPGSGEIVPAGAESPSGPRELRLVRW